MATVTHIDAARPEVAAAVQCYYQCSLEIGSVVGACSMAIVVIVKADRGMDPICLANEPGKLLHSLA
jgi:hypothetical protein